MMRSGMIGHLNCRLSASAEFALTDGVFGVSFQFPGESHLYESLIPVADDLGFTVHDANKHSASCRAERADARLPGGDAPVDHFFRDEADHLMFGVAATGQCCAGAGQCSDFQEVASVHLFKVPDVCGSSVQSEVTGDAVDRRLLLLVTCDTETHRVIDNAFCVSHTPDIAVAFGAGYRSCKMRSMIEADVRLIVPAIDALPGNFFSAIEICRDLLHRRLVFRDGLVTSHAPLDAGNSGARAGERSGVAIQALHLCLLNVRFVIVGNGLYRFRPQSKEVTDSKRYAGVRRSEDARCTNRRIRRNGLPFQDATFKKEPRT